MANPSDVKYFRGRAKDSRMAAANADYAGASKIHTTLAVEYDDLASEATDPQAPRDTPSTVEAVNVKVQLEGLEDGSISFTPDAARSTSDSLSRGANQAEQQSQNSERSGSSLEVKINDSSKASAAKDDI